LLGLSTFFMPPLFRHSVYAYAALLPVWINIVQYVSVSSLEVVMERTLQFSSFYPTIAEDVVLVFETGTALAVTEAIRIAGMVYLYRTNLGAFFLNIALSLLVEVLHQNSMYTQLHSCITRKWCNMCGENCTYPVETRERLWCIFHGTKPFVYTLCLLVLIVANAFGNMTLLNDENSKLISSIDVRNHQDWILVIIIFGVQRGYDWLSWLFTQLSVACLCLGGTPQESLKPRLKFFVPIKTTHMIWCVMSWTYLAMLGFYWNIPPTTRESTCIDELHSLALHCLGVLDADFL